MRSISLEAGHGPAYLHGILKGGKNPSVANLATIAKVLGISIGEITEGLPVSAETQELIEIWEKLSKEQRAAYLALGKQLADTRR